MDIDNATSEPSVDTSGLYRMPWTDSDNAFSWLEITRRCDLQCGYCYQTNDPGSDLSIAQIERDLKTLLHLRNCDTVFISGGEPLLHPRLEEIIRMVRSHRKKAVLVTNGHKLNARIVSRLKMAGAAGFILHVDRGQSRPGWTGKSERQLNRLRQDFADMIYAQKGLLCGFNTTILPETLSEVPDIVAWTVKNIRKVCTITLIPVRVPRADDPWDLVVKGQKIAFEDTAFAAKPYTNPSKTVLTARHIYDEVKKAVPGFKANAFLGGTEIPNAPKWLFGNVMGNGERMFGHLGPKTMEILQNGHHLLTNRFLSFLTPALYRRGGLLFWLGLMDRQLRSAFAAYGGAVLRHPLHLFKGVCVQSLLIMQPQDILPSGKQDLCDGCPNKTVHGERLVPMCRKEEYLQFGDRVTLIKRAA